MQADRPPRRFAVYRKELPNPEPSAGTDYHFVEACSFVRGMANRVHKLALLWLATTDRATLGARRRGSRHRGW
jgi:hypothetical protein